MWLTLLYYLFAEGDERGKGEFEMLHTPWDAYNRAAEDKSESEMRERDFPPAKYNPQDIEDYLQATSIVGSWHQLMTKRP